MTAVLPAVDFVTAVSEISNDQVMFWKLGMQQRFQPPEMLLPFGKRVSDQADMIAFVEFN